MTRPPRSRRARRLNLVLTASLTALLIIVGVQYFSLRQPEILRQSQREISPPPPPVITVPEVPAPTPAPSQPAGPPPEAIVPAAPTIAPSAPSTPPPPETIQPKQEVVTGEPPPAPPVEPPLAETVLPPPTFPSKSVRLYQQQVHELSEDALAQVEVMVNAMGGQILTQFALSDVLAYGIRAVRADLIGLDRLIVPPEYDEKHREVLRTVAGLLRFGRELRGATMQPAAAELQERLVALQARLDEALRAVDSF